MDLSKQEIELFLPLQENFFYKMFLIFTKEFILWN